MRYSTLTEIPTSRDMLETFGGYNHNPRIGDGENFDEMNLTSDYYPTMANRPKRGLYTLPESNNETQHEINGMISKDALIYIDGTDVYFDNHKVSGLSLDPSIDPAKRQLVSMGAKVIFFPDNMYLNTKDETDYGSLANRVIIGEGASSEGTAVPVTFNNVSLAETLIDISPTISDTAPEEPAGGAYWIDTSETPAAMKVYAATMSAWIPAASVYIKITADGINEGFAEGDGITLSGINVSGHPELADLNNTMVIQAIGNDYIVVIGILKGESATQSAYHDGSVDTRITVSRDIPLMDYVCESNNRLWGCRYGLNAKGDVVNELYASKLGDAGNWSCFAGISTDSYVVSLGSDGMFTGAITYLGYPLFFKENCVHKVYGDYPANFKVTETALRGVERGSHRSLAMVNETLFYKARTGIMAYTGALPSEVSTALGEVRYTNAVGGANNNKYYVSMTEIGKLTPTLFVFDVAKNIWHKEDNIPIKQMVSQDGDMLAAIDGGTASDKILILNGGGSAEADIEWFAETGPLMIYTHDRKYVSRLNIRMSLDLGSVVRIYIQYDSVGEWDNVCTLSGTRLTPFSFPVKPKRCDHAKLRIEGRGNAKIYSISKTIEGGSDY